MPELPEVSVAIQAIYPQIVGRPILSAEVSKHLQGEWWDKKYLESGFVINDVRRRGKHVEVYIVQLDQVQKFLNTPLDKRDGFKIPPSARGRLVIHLGMSGMITTITPLSEPQPHRHMNILLGDGLWSPPHLSNTWGRSNPFFQMYDPRKFGRISVCKSPEDLKRRYRRVGPDAVLISAEDRGTGIPSLNPEKGAKIFIGRIRKRKRTWPIKKCLLDQRAVSGFGNIYASEALFEAGIHPKRPIGKVRKQSLHTLYTKSLEIFMAAMMAGGSSINSYKNPNGVGGTYQHQHKVYNKDKQPCQICDTTIKSCKIDGRSTYWCPTCQK